MMKFLLLVVYLINLCAADNHSWGHNQLYMTHRLYERKLIDDNNDVPKNYTIIYKYIGSYFKPVAYLEINVNSKSSGYIHHSTKSVTFRKRYPPDTVDVFDAKIHINYAGKVEATLTIYGIGIMGILPGSTKSFTVVHVKNALPVFKTKQFAQNSIGHRREGDKLIRFESRNVTNVNRFPSKSFEYSGIESNEYITYVGFSFNSPTAMVLVNSSFVSEQEFNAIVYDLNTEHFVANMSIYGVKNVRRPYAFLGVI